MAGLSEENKAKIGKVMKFFFQVSMAATPEETAARALEIYPDPDEAITRLRGTQNLYREKGQHQVVLRIGNAIFLIAKGEKEQC